MNRKLIVDISEGEAGHLAVLLTGDDGETPLDAGDVSQVLFSLKRDDGTVINGRENEDVTANFDPELLERVPPKNFKVYLGSADTALDDQSSDREVKRALFQIEGIGAEAFSKPVEIVIIVRNIKSKSA